MGCYAISLAAAAMVYFIRRNGDSPELKMLNTMLVGGAIFGIIDHAWNGELFSFSSADMVLGTIIAFATLGIWALIAYGPTFLRSIVVV